MKVSIVTIAYNSAETIRETLESVANQNYPNIEYIVIDGASKDGTQAIVEEFSSSVSTFVSEPDKGIYDAMNKGLAKATGDIVGILNSDDVYAHPEVISKVVEQFKATGADGLYADLVYVDREDLDQVKRHWKSGAYYPGRFVQGWMPPHPTFFMKRSCYDQHGVFNTDFKTSADYELMLRYLHKHQIEVTYLEDIIIKMRVGGQSNVSIKNRIRANKEDRDAWKVNELQPGWFTLTRKPLSKIKQFFRKS